MLVSTKRVLRFGQEDDGLVMLTNNAHEDGLAETQLWLPAEDYAQMGEPDAVTIEVKPGDLLNSSNGAGPAKVFHSQDGLYFGRMPNGSVYVRWEEKETVLPEATWASVVASVCFRGETSETFNDAKQFHSFDPMAGT